MTDGPSNISLAAKSVNIIPPSEKTLKIAHIIKRASNKICYHETYGRKSRQLGVVSINVHQLKIVARLEGVYTK